MATVSITPAVSEQIIAFVDLRGYHRHICSKLSPGQIFEFLTSYYSVAQLALARDEGQIVKFIGDAMLLLFPAVEPRDAMNTLETLKTETDSFLALRGYDSCLCIKAHIGTVAVGTLGEGDLQNIDVCGVAVNQTALLPAGEWSLSKELQLKLELD